MHRLGRVLLLLIVIALVAQCTLAGGSFLFDREQTLPGGSAFQSVSIVPRGNDGSLVCIVVDGKICPYRWASSFLEGLDQFGSEVDRVLTAPVEAQVPWLMLLTQNGLDYQLWRQTEDSWLEMAGGSLGGRVVAAACGRFAAGEGVGLFAQFDSGRIGYWQVGREGCVPVWQSPDPFPGCTLVRNADFDGDGLDEILAIGTTGAISIMRWYHGIWETVWTLPPWGQVLSLDLGQADLQSGLEIAVVTSQRRLFLIGAAGGTYAVKARFTTTMIASQVALLPDGQGAVVLADAAGDLHLFLPEADSWRHEATMHGSERLSWLVGLGPEHILAGGVSGSLGVLRLMPLGCLAVFYDDVEVKNGGLYWEDGDFYFSPEFLQRVLGITSKWDERKSSLALIFEDLIVSMLAEKTEVSINGRPWSVGHAFILADKVPYVPADLLRSVFLINVTHDPGADLLILTSPTSGST